MDKEKNMFDNTKKDRLKKIPLDRITISRLNVRQSDKNENIDDLANSIKQLGLLVPISVYEADNERYILISGQRRYLAYKKLNETDPQFGEIPAIVTEISNDLEVQVKSFVENIQRRDLSYRDKMQAATILMSNYKDLTTVAKVLGVTVITVKSYLGYSAVPEEIKKLVDNNKLSARSAVRIFQNIDDTRLAIDIAKQMPQYPNAYERRLLISLAKKYPDKSSDELKELVSHIGQPFTLHFDPDIRDRLKKASNIFNIDEDEIIAQSVEEWLDRNGVKQ